MLKDELEVQILMKHVDYSTYIISIFLCKKTFFMFVEFVNVVAITLISECFLPNIVQT